MSPSLLLIHLIPCSCGSMISGYLLHEVMTAAFSRETLSAGRFYVYQRACSAGFDNTKSGSTPSVSGTFYVTISASHSSFQRLLRYF